MSAITPHFKLSLDFDQILDLVGQLPEKEKKQLVDALLEQAVSESEIPEAQKQLVRERIDKYNLHPGLLVEEERALEIINQL